MVVNMCVDYRAPGKGAGTGFRFCAATTQCNKQTHTPTGVPMHLTQTQRQSIVESFVTDLTPMIDLASEYGVTRQGIWKVIKKSGVDIASQSRLDVTCYACGETINRTRGRIRNNTHHYCNFECYQAFLDAGNGNIYKPSKKGQRIARKVVSEFITLLEGNVVHHEDRNCLHNEPKNLKVFANQGDHVRHHRGCYAKPLWEWAK